MTFRFALPAYFGLRVCLDDRIFLCQGCHASVFKKKKMSYVCVETHQNVLFSLLVCFFKYDMCLFFHSEFESLIPGRIELKKVRSTVSRKIYLSAF